jgi:hypothetical protein
VSLVKPRRACSLTKLQPLPLSLRMSIAPHRPEDVRKLWSDSPELTTPPDWPLLGSRSGVQQRDHFRERTISNNTAKFLFCKDQARSNPKVPDSIGLYSAAGSKIRFEPDGAMPQKATWLWLYQFRRQPQRVRAAFAQFLQADDPGSLR